MRSSKARANTDEGLYVTTVFTGNWDRILEGGTAGLPVRY
jgi:hypothetical protein